MALPIISAADDGTPLFAVYADAGSSMSLVPAWGECPNSRPTPAAPVEGQASR